jgi:hypothetical protein
MDVRDLAVPDYHDFVNAVLLGPSLPGLVSFRVEWAASKDKQEFDNPDQQYDGHMVLTSARCSWTGATSDAMYVSHPDPLTQVSVYAQVGHMRNGVFFS